MCQQRWNRLPLKSEQMLREPQGDDLVTFGKYSGVEYRRILEDLSYCQWVLYTAESGELCSAGLMRLARYLAIKSEAALQEQSQGTSAASDVTMTC